jgi:ATP-dependent protease ClpP protease subunit
MTHVYPLKVRIRNEAGVTRVDVFDDIGGGGWFSDGVSASDFANQLAAIKGNLEVHINSGGGDVFDGITIGNSIRGHKGKVTTVVDGLAASIASVIAQAGQERVAEPGSMFMIHDAFGCCMGDSAEMAKMADTLDKVSANIASIYADRAGGTPDSWRAQMKSERWYTAEEAVAAGLADKVGTGKAELPAGLDVANFAGIPSGIAAALRTLPVAKAPDPEMIRLWDATHPLDGQHSHSHSAYGHPTGDDDGMHSHMHSHGGDGDHGHSHATDGPSDRQHGPQGHGARPEQTCADLGHQCCHEAASAKALLQGIVRDEVALALPKAAQGKPGTHGDHERWDPDGDGDCDACPEGDTDNSHWSPDGKQTQDVPGKPMPAGDKAVTLDDLRALFGEFIGRMASTVAGNAADVDNSAWDASKAWHNGAESDDPAAFYAGICAGEKAGDKGAQDAWALPYKYTPGSPVNAAGVRNALARLPQTEGLTNAAEAKATLQAAMKKVNPDWEPPEDRQAKPASGFDLQQFQTALEGATR